METKPTSPAIHGVIIALILIVFGLIVHFGGLNTVQGINAIQYVLFAGGIIWACITYAKQREANVTFGNTFAHGFKVTAAVTGITAVYTYLAFKFIMPELMDIALDQARASMVEQNKMSEADISKALDMSRKYFVPFAIGGVIVAFLIFGCICSLIGAAVAKKNPNYNPLLEQ
jgi:cation transport ATPase